MKKIMLFAVLFSFVSGVAQAQYSNESEVSIIVTGGNTDMETYDGKTLNSYVHEKNTFKLGGHYTYGKSNDAESARNWDVNARYERAFSTVLSGYFASQVEADKFKGFDPRYNEDLGAIYNFINTDLQKLKTEFGYRYVVEKRVDDTYDHYSALRLYGEYQRQINEGVSASLGLEYLHNIDESKDWMLKGGPSMTVILTRSFSLKLSYLGTYDNQPSVSGNKKFDYEYKTSLVAKF
jgi:putative salt-induced outer membrane protein